MRVAGVTLPLAPVVLGTAADGAPLGDVVERYLALGGTTFDTARWYGTEEELGSLLAGVDRSRLVVVTKGGHPAAGYGRARLGADELAADLDASRTALGTERIDLYLLHRDDPGVPVGRILEQLVAHREAGAIEAYGASNWTTARLDEAAAYARANGLEPFAASSANLALAPMRVPAWPGCVSAGDAASRAWHARTGLPLLAWSPLARGWFDGERAPDWAGAELDRVFGGPVGEARRERARLLARRLGATPTQVALAWTLAQPFPVAAVVGARTPAEVESCLAAARLALADEDVRFLEHGAA